MSFDASFYSRRSLEGKRHRSDYYQSRRSNALRAEVRYLDFRRR